MIIDAPSSAVDIDSRIKITCRSKSTAEGAQLIWYRDGRPVDISYTMGNGFIINELELKMSTVGARSLLVCQLDYPAANLLLNTSVTVQATGHELYNAAFNFELLCLCFQC